jgi:isopentenyl diphosphate isomerase/L-lactate dehydrogenase-like FMN-dependent dehydrogenase
MALLLAIPLVALPVLAPQPASAQNERLVLAFYYNWFDENTWTPAKVPDFPAQTYVSRDRGVMDRHIAQAQAAGIDAFVVSWYGPGGGNQTEGNFAAMLEVAAARGFKLALDVEAGHPRHPSRLSARRRPPRHLLLGQLAAVGGRVGDHPRGG